MAHPLDSDSAEDAGTHVSRAEWLEVRAYFRAKVVGTEEKNSGRRRQANRRAVEAPRRGPKPGPAQDVRAKYTVRLSPCEWAALCRLARKTGQPARTLMRVRILHGGGALM